MTEEYVVEEILKWRYNLRNQRREFFIKWLGWDHKDNTWEPESNLNCPELLKKFIKKLPKKEESYYFSTEPAKLTGFQRNATYKGVIGADGPHDSDDEDGDKRRPQRQAFYCLVRFDDSDYAEEVTIDEFYSYMPKESFEFLEGRLLLRDENRIEKLSKKVKSSSKRSSRSRSCSRKSSRM